MNTVTRLWALFAIGLLAGTTACAANSEEEDVDGSEDAISRTVQTKDAEIQGQCVGNEAASLSVKAEGGGDGKFWSAFKEQVPVEFVVKDASGREIAKKAGILKENGTPVAEIPLPREAAFRAGAKTKYTVELKADREALSSQFDDDQAFVNALQIIKGSKINEVKGACSQAKEGDLAWSKDLAVLENPPPSEVQKAMLAALADGGYAGGSFKSTAGGCSGKNELGAPFGGEFKVSGGGAGRLAVLYERHSYAAGTARYRVQIIERNFGSMGRDEYAAIRPTAASGSTFEDIIGVAGAKLGGGSLDVSSSGRIGGGYVCTQ
jgi:hypothetical protein